MTGGMVVAKRHSTRRSSSVLVALPAACLCICVGVVAAAHGFAPSPPISVDEPRLVVVKGARIAYLFDGDELIRSYPVDLGLAPIGQKLRAADGRTPVGMFRVVTKNASSPYHRFLGLDYPDETAVTRGLQTGLVTQGEASRIRSALARGQCPDWTTALGGGIGLHGHRKGRNWTAGCVALSDRHIEELFAVLRIGDRVEILP